MSLLAWFRASGSQERLKAIERQLEQLRRKLDEDGRPPIQIEYANVEKIIIEKWEHSNNFGALGIKELGGTLNIGANYKGPLPEELLKQLTYSVGKPGEGVAGTQDGVTGSKPPAAAGSKPPASASAARAGPPAYTIRSAGHRSL